jgi:hypothetical protein
MVKGRKRGIERGIGSSEKDRERDRDNTPHQTKKAPKGLFYPRTRIERGRTFGLSGIKPKILHRLLWC